MLESDYQGQFHLELLGRYRQDSEFSHRVSLARVPIPTSSSVRELRRIRARTTQWSPTRTSSITTLPIGNCTYSTSFSPSNPAIISAVSSDSHIRIFDLRTPVSAKYHLTATIPVHSPGNRPDGSFRQLSNGQTYAGAVPAEVLTHDWNKYRDTVIATGGVDRVLRTFDIRNPNGGPTVVLEGHEYAVRRLAWSPHASDVLISASYDMTVRVWTDGSMVPPQQQQLGPPDAVRAGTQLGLMNRHTEFATGVDWCLFGTGGWVASVGWDERVLLWDVHSLLRR